MNKPRNTLSIAPVTLSRMVILSPDRTFPQPTLPGASPLQVSAIVTALMVLLMEAQGKAKAREDQEWEKYKEELVKRSLWTYDGILHLHVYQAEGRVHMRHTVERYLPGRILTPQERKTLIDACLTELPHRESVVAPLTEFDKFCQLLRQPENHVLRATPVYADREVNTYTAAEMTNQVARELLNLPPRTAYAKVVSLAPGSTSVWKGKIQTLALEETRVSVGDISRRALRHALDRRILKRRTDIEAEIRERQENWRRRGGDEEPPPTQTKNTSPPLLQSGRTQKDEEPPPTHSPSDKTPALMPTPAESAGAAKNRADAPGEELAQALRVSLPSLGDSIEKVSHEMNGRYVKLLVHLHGRVLFRKEHIVFTTGSDPPVFDEKQIRNMEQRRTKTKRKIVIAIPYTGNAVQEITKTISGNYLHILIHGTIASFFDENKVTFPHSRKEASGETSSTLAVKVLWVKFFESGHGYPPIEARCYNTRFPQATARFVNFELNVANLLYKKRDQTHHVWVRLLDPTGGLVWEDQHDWVIDADCEYTWITWGWGNDKPKGHWIRGIYRVVILIDGVERAEGSFTITGSKGRGNLNGV